MTRIAPPDRYAGVAQAVRLLALIRQHPKSRHELAEALGVHERTIRRLIEALRTGGLAIEQARVPPSLELRYRVR